MNTVPFKVIRDKGVNAAYLNPGEVGISLGHAFCALTILTNGQESFMMHLPHPDNDLIPELIKIKNAMGGTVKAKLYQENIGDAGITTPKQEKVDGYIRLLGEVVGNENVEAHPGSLGDYAVTAAGDVENFSPGKGLQQKYGHDFATMHSRQLITSIQTVQPPSAIHPFTGKVSHKKRDDLRYSDVPAIFSDPAFHIKTGDKIVPHSQAGEWNSIAQQYIDCDKQQSERPQHSILTMHAENEPLHFSSTYKCF